MALSADQKQRIIELLALKWTAARIAAEVGCSARTVARVSKLPKNDSIAKIARKAMAAKTLDEQGSAIVETLQTMAEREPAMQEQLWIMFEGLAKLFNGVLERTDYDDVSPRQLPGIAKAAADMSAAYADYSDRINGIQILADEVEKLTQNSAA